MQLNGGAAGEIEARVAPPCTVNGQIDLTQVPSAAEAAPGPAQATPASQADMGMPVDQNPLRVQEANNGIIGSANEAAPKLLRTHAPDAGEQLDPEGESVGVYWQGRDTGSLAELAPQVYPCLVPVARVDGQGALHDATAI